MENTNPEQAIWQMCAAHNRVARIGGYSPAQWALGRDLEERNNLVIQTAQGDRISEMSHNLQVRLRAEATYCKLQSEAKISRALNSRPQQVLVVKVAAATAIGYLTSTSSSSLDHCHQLFRKQMNLHTKKKKQIHSFAKDLSPKQMAFATSRKKNRQIKF